MTNLTTVYNRLSWSTYCCYLVTKSCPTLWDPMDCNPPASSVHGIFLAKILEWVVMSSSRGSIRPRDGIHVSCIGMQILYHWAIGEAHHHLSGFHKRSIPGEGQDNPLQYSCLETPHGQRSLAGYLQSIGSQRVRHDWAQQMIHSLNFPHVIFVCKLFPFYRVKASYSIPVKKKEKLKTQAN